MRTFVELIVLLSLLLFMRATKFVSVIQAVKHFSTTHLPPRPNRKNIGGRLPCFNHMKYMNETTSHMFEDVEWFGLTAMGDGTIICTCHDINVLLLGGNFLHLHFYSFLLAI